MKLKKEEMVSFDSLRAIASFGVVVCHAFYIFYKEPLTLLLDSWMWFLGRASVMLFFVMSGFLIGNSIQNNKNRNGQFRISEYAKDRALRIFPPLLTLLFFVFFLSTGKGILKRFFNWDWLQHFPHFGIENFLVYATFMNGFSVKETHILTLSLWTLSIEVWLYVIFGLFFIPKKFFKFLSFLLFYIFWSVNSAWPLSVVWLASFFFSFLDLRKISKANILLIFVGIFMLAFYLFQFISSLTIIENMKFSVALGLIFLLLIILLIRFNLFKINIFRNFSASSYTLYLFHMPILVIFSFIGTGMPLAIISTIISIFTSCLIAKYLENKKFILKTISY